MPEPNSYRATIAPVPPGTPRPLWSVMIPTYNCANYLAETLRSVLDQDPGPELMQIEVVDDCSTRDDPEAVVQEIGKGRVAFYRQPQNGGYIKNFETCLQRSRGHLIHQLHGDDCVRPGFYATMQQAFEAAPHIGAAFCRTILMDENSHWQAFSMLLEPRSGILDKGLERLAAKCIPHTPAIVVRREVYETLGGFDSRFQCWAEDWEMWARIASRYAVWHEVEPLALYRVRSNSISGPGMQSGQNVRDLRAAIDIINHYLPEQDRGRVKRQSLQYYALFSLDAARGFARQGNVKAARTQIQEALQCSREWSVAWPASKMTLKFLLKPRSKAC